MLFVAFFAALAPAIVRHLMRSEALIQLRVAESGQQRAVDEIAVADLSQDAGRRLIAAALPEPPMEIEILARAAVEVLVLGIFLQRLGQVFEVACVRRPKISAGKPE